MKYLIWKLIIGITIWFSAQKSLWAQPLDFPNQPIPVLNNAGDYLLNPFAGGLNAPQFNTMDIDRDGQMDLILFDRSANKLSTFIYEDENWSYRPAFEYLFPDNLVNWVLLRDFDCDGKKDLFTSTNLGIKVYHNSSEDDGPLLWELEEDPILTLGNDLINLFVNTTDLPAIYDVDEDGDLDILVFNFATGGFIEFHKNNSIEETGSCGIGPFIRETRTWGDFQECICGIFAYGNEDCPASNRVMHSAGKALTLFDQNGDGSADIFFGEELCPSLFFLPNEGASSNDLFRSSHVQFTTVKKQLLFPAVYFLEDLPSTETSRIIVSSNSRANSLNQQDWKNSVYSFRFQGNQWQGEAGSFLQDQMIDVGENAYPAFGDIDKDGDLDLVIGNRGSIMDDQFLASLHVYRNIGNSVAPEFQFLTDDYLSISDLALLNIKPAFQDLNDDGIEELIFTALEGNQNKLFILNASSSGYDLNNASSISLPINELDNLTLIDLDDDEILDALVGTSSGRLDRYTNLGSNTEPVFERTARGYLSIDTDPSRTNLSVSVLRRNKSLLLYDDSGEIRFIENILATDPKIQPIILGDVLKESSLGRIGKIAPAKLYQNQLTLFLGNNQGGLQQLDLTLEDSNEEDNWQITYYPNPVIDKVSIITNRPATGQLISLSGKKVRRNIAFENIGVNRLDIRNLSQGIYILQLSDGSQQRSLKIIVNE